MISFLSSAKAFSGRNRVNQLKAIKSWLAISPGVEVILYGCSQGADEICAELGITYVSHIKSTSTGVPYFDAIADHARQHARHDTQIYLNCDILMTNSLLKAIKRVPFKKYLMSGQRLDLSEDADFDINRSDWMDQLINLKKGGFLSLHPAEAADYFVFPRGLWEGVPSLIVGRAGYDNGLMAFCIKRRIPIIDATHDIVSIHQYHDYSHLLGNRAELSYNGENFNLRHGSPEVSDADWMLQFAKLGKKSARGDYLRCLELIVRTRLGWVLPGYGLRAIWRIRGALRIHRTKSTAIEKVLEGYGMTLGAAIPSD